MEGIIMKALSGFYYVDDGQTVTTCRGRGKLRHQKVTPWWETGWSLPPWGTAVAP